MTSYILILKLFIINSIVYVNLTHYIYLQGSSNLTQPKIKLNPPYTAENLTAHTPKISIMTGVELLVGGWFASPVIRRVVDKAQKYLGGNFELQKGTQGMVETLTSTLVLTQATVKEVEKRTIINNPDLAAWLRMLKETVYDAEDVLDNMEAKSIKEKVQGKNKVSKLASSSLSGLRNMFFPDDNCKSLKKVVDKLKQLSTDITNFVNLVNMNENYESHIREVTDQRETISQPLEEVGLYGRQDELNLILEIILGSDSESSKKGGQNYNNYQGLFVIPIVGMGGVGKTALAQAVYNNPEVQQTFASKAWISISYNADVILVMRKINQSLGGYLRLDVITLEDISKNLSSIIGGVKFLIVLDDIGTLRIENFENIKNKDEAMLANLVDKKHLDSICIYSSTTRRKSNVDMEVLEELQPHKDIKELRIRSYAGSVFPNWIIQIEVLPPLGELPSLKFLQIQHFHSVKLINYHLYGKKQTVFPLLEELFLNTLSNCEEWTDARAREFFPRLSKLTITNHKPLREAPLHFFSSSLKELTINECDSLISLEKSILHLSSLTLLKLCNSSMSVSFDPLDMPLLEDLNLENCSELKIKGDLQSLTHLKRLRIVNCSNLLSKYSTKDQQKGKGLQVHRDEGLRSLTHIEADHSLLHHEYHLILGSLPSLRVLNFKNSEFTRFTNHQILWFQELTALKEIHFSNCEFEHLPASLTLLSSLKKVVLISCTKLESLSDSMPPYLQELTLMGCSQNLVQRCQPNEGEDWQFISHIPVIQIDGITIRKPQISDVTVLYGYRWNPQIRIEISILRCKTWSSS
ncbi:Disease resistance protein RGA2 [Carex littledalei]|uniref:Disease resistance protein RGA2 n=1 Tax=Carex littledalei TaxID=544730 RepID=A0A833RFW0_9POAL|nr:Disease resistance protein RGA2 [Carex littledalei]